MRVSRQGGGVRGAQGYLVSLWPVYTHLLPTPPIPAQAPLLSLEACPVELQAGLYPPTPRPQSLLRLHVCSWRLALWTFTLGTELQTRSLWLLALGNGLKTPHSLSFFRSFMNNWEVYKLLAHVRPPVSKVLASCCLPLAVSLLHPPTVKRSPQSTQPSALLTSLPTCLFSGETWTPRS